MPFEENTIKEAVKERYGAIARSQQSSCCEPTTCCDSADINLVGTLYSQTDLTHLPDTVTDLSLGCGNPTAMASLRPGETVLDLGSGGGIDCFLAAGVVGPEGYVIGVDMTDDMLARARQNKANLGITNVEFRKGEIEDLPLADETVDVIISNCVINLSPDKDTVFREAFRVLKPGGRLIVSDIVTDGPLPPPLMDNLAGWVGCINGALDQQIYLEKLGQAGFVEVAIQSRTPYGAEVLALMDEATRQTLLEDVDLVALGPGPYLYSANIAAHKP